MNEKTTINSICPNLWAPTAGLLQGLTVMQQCVYTRKSLGMFVRSRRLVHPWIGLEQNIIDTAVNEWTKHLDPCIVFANTSSNFTAGSWKMDNWMKCQPQCQKCKQNVFLRVMLIKQDHIALDKKVIFRWLCFPQVVQKQMLGEMENWMVIWWQVVSGIFAPKIIKIWSSVFKLLSKMSGMFFETRCNA